MAQGKFGRAVRLAVAVTAGALAPAASWAEGEVITKQYDNGATYEGTFVNGLQDGTGIYRMPNGFEYSGDWVAGQIMGKGRARYPDGWSRRACCAPLNRLPDDVRRCTPLIRCSIC